MSQTKVSLINLVDDTINNDYIIPYENTKSEKDLFDEVNNIMYNVDISREKPLEVVFYKTQMNNQPCRDFLLELDSSERREVGADIFSVQKELHWES